MNNLLVFAFAMNISSSVLKKLNVPNKMFVYSSVKGIDKLLSHINNNDYKYILGMGMYSRPSKKLRIEMITKNNLSGKKIKDKPQELIINNFLSESLNAKLAKGLGTSYCNYVSYRIATEFPSMKYSFIHIPRRYNVDSAVLDIEQMLNKRL